MASSHPTRSAIEWLAESGLLPTSTREHMAGTYATKPAVQPTSWYLLLSIRAASDEQRCLRASTATGGEPGHGGSCVVYGCAGG